MEAAKAQAKQFVQSLPVRFNVGLVSFCDNASAVLAPTMDRDAIDHGIDGLQLCKGTAIGEAVFTAVNSIRSFDARAAQDPVGAENYVTGFDLLVRCWSGNAVGGFVRLRKDIGVRHCRCLWHYVWSILLCCACSAGLYWWSVPTWRWMPRY